MRVETCDKTTAQVSGLVRTSVLIVVPDFIQPIVSSKLWGRQKGSSQLKLGKWCGALWKAGNRKGMADAHGAVRPLACKILQSTWLRQ